MSVNERDEFSKEIKEILQRRAGFICSNPLCKKMTIAPSVNDDTKVQYDGVCAHITAAKVGGPRYDETLKSEERSGFQNGIFLCGSCSILIDKNKGIDYKKETLIQWKKDHEKWLVENLNKSFIEKSSGVTSNNQFGGITANVVNISAIDVQNLNSKQYSRDEHDKKIFYSANKILDEENIKAILEGMVGSESIRSSRADIIESLISFYSLTSNNYINANIENARKTFLESLKEVSTFISGEFFTWPPDQLCDDLIYCMSPRTNFERGGEYCSENDREHNRLHKSLYDKARKAIDDFDNLRKEIKNNLCI